MTTSPLVIYVLIVAFPSLTLLYAICALFMNAAWHECSWDSMTKQIASRFAFLVASVAVSIALIEGSDQQNQQQQWYMILPLSMFFTLTSLYGIQQTRYYDICGGPPPKFQPNCLQGKVILVTGANAGIGKETVRQLSLLGAGHIILACRSQSRAEDAMKDIRNTNSLEQTNTATKLHFLPLDLSSLQSVRESIHVLKDTLGFTSIDILINNAGVMMAEHRTTQDGHELTMQANHLGHFLLTNLLLEHGFFSSSPSKTEKDNGSQGCVSLPRIITVSSSTYKLATNGMDFKDLMCTKSRTYSLFGQYAQSKLANILFAKELASRYSNGDSKYTPSSNPKIWSVAAHPGLVRTDVVRNMPWYLRSLNKWFGAIVGSLQKTPTQGAYTSVWAAAASENDKPPTGSYLVNWNVQETNQYANSKDDAVQLWNISEELVSVKNNHEKLNNDNQKTYRSIEK